MRTICWVMAKLRWRARGARGGRFGRMFSELSGLLAAIWNESVGTEVPPTTAAALWEGLPLPCGRAFRPDASRSGRDARKRGRRENVRVQNT
ncbi:DUF6053 domain-containing protein [Lysobacter enzymogenes]|uniref:DUF6053 domain-containing protein n=1 Tax=Lysobacter enzymogenes TaxID=69 RepID=UPI003D18AE2B